MFGKTYRNCVKAEGRNSLKEDKLDSYSNKWKLWKSLDDVEKWNLSQVPALAKYNKGQGNFDFNFYDKVYRDLKQIIENKELPKTQGFFFGNDSYQDYREYGYEAADKEFVEKALKALDEGYEIIYTCSW